MVDEELLLAVRLGLANVNQTSSQLRLVCYTAQKYSSVYS